jgi:hypothetical protein
MEKRLTELSTTPWMGLTEKQIDELSHIGSQHLYLGAMDEGRLSSIGVLEILKRYEELRKLTNNG